VIAVAVTNDATGAMVDTGPPGPPKPIDDDMPTVAAPPKPFVTLPPAKPTIVIQKSLNLDRLADTVDYGALAQTAADVVGGRSYRLLEALAGRLASALLIVDPRLEAVEVTVRKLRPPLALDVGSTGVRVRRAR